MFKNVTVASGLVLAMAVSSAQALVVIDTFDLTPSMLSENSAGAPSGFQDTAAPEAIGGNRALIIDSVTGPGTVNADVFAPVPGVFALSNPALTASVSRILWDGPFGIGLGANLIANGEDALQFDIVSIDQGNLDLFITITDSPAAGFDTASLLLSNLGVGTETALFTGFSNIAAIDLTNIHSVILEIRAGEASDLTLDLFGTTRVEEQPVPEPMSAGLLSLAGLALLRRRR